MTTVDPVEHLEALGKAFEGGDTLALLQAIRFAQNEGAALQNWAMEPMAAQLIAIMTKPKLGTKGRGNAPFGSTKKGLVRTVRATAYRSVRAWQQNPHLYVDMPRATILAWYEEERLWQEWRGYSDAARLAAIGLHGTPYQANAATVRKAAIKFPLPVRFGRSELELELGLRGAAGIFGPPPGDPPSHVENILSEHSAEP